VIYREKTAPKAPRFQREVSLGLTGNDGSCTMPYTYFLFRVEFEKELKKRIFLSMGKFNEDTVCKKRGFWA